MTRVVLIGRFSFEVINSCFMIILDLVLRFVCFKVYLEVFHSCWFEFLHESAPPSHLLEHAAHERASPALTPRL